MAWQSATVLVCSPQGTVSSELCPAGTSLTTQIAYLPSTNPDIPSTIDLQLVGWGFALVVTTYVIATGIGLLLRIFRDQ